MSGGAVEYSTLLYITVHHCSPLYVTGHYHTFTVHHCTLTHISLHYGTSLCTTVHSEQPFHCEFAVDDSCKECKSMYTQVTMSIHVNTCTSCKGKPLQICINPCKPISAHRPFDGISKSEQLRTPGAALYPQNTLNDLHLPACACCWYVFS